MRLREIQQHIGTVLWQEGGLGCLDSETEWDNFHAQLPAAAFTRHLTLEKLALYESLLKNTVEETLATLFPYCRFLLGDSWPEISEQYRRLHPNRSFQLYHCGQDFPGFLEQQEELCTTFPYLSELALYEWLEADVENAPDQSLPSSFMGEIPATPDDLQRYHPVWNAASSLNGWTYDIPLIITQLAPMLEAFADDEAEADEISSALENLSADPTAKSLLIYRDRLTHRARFFELNHLTSQLLKLSADPHLSYFDLFSQLKQNTPALANIPLETILQQGQALLQQCQSAQILLGSAPCGPLNDNGNER